MVHVATPRPNLGSALGQALGSYGASQYNRNYKQQLEQQKQEKAKQQQSLLAQTLFPNDPQKQTLFAQMPETQQLAVAKLQQPKEPPGGIGAQPVPPEVSSKIENIIKNNPEASADELTIMMNNEGVPPYYSNIAIETRRRSDENNLKNFYKDRSYHGEEAKKAKDKVSKLQENLPKTKMALDMALDAVKSKEVGAFSLNNLSERLGIDELKTAKGVQLITAGKENLIGNLSSVSARAQNLWIEQRFSSMFPKIGQSEESNETIESMLRANYELDELYVKKFNELAEEDEKKFGYIKGDIDRRVNSSIKPEQEKILKKVSFNTRMIYEREKGADWMRDQVNKKPTPGTVLTPQMVKIMAEHFKGDLKKVLNHAEKLGYEIPTESEYREWL